MLRVRWLGRVRYRDAHALQHGLFASSPDDHLLLLEHPHVYTLGVRADMGNVLVPPADVGAELVRADRGGDVTYHGPGQLVGYPILTVPGKRGGGMADTVAYVRSVEQLVIDALADLGLRGAGRLDGYPGVWVERPQDRGDRRAAQPRAHDARVRAQRRSRPDLLRPHRAVRHPRQGRHVARGAKASTSTCATVVDAVVARAVERWGADGLRARRRRVA